MSLLAGGLFSPLIDLKYMHATSMNIVGLLKSPQTDGRDLPTSVVSIFFLHAFFPSLDVFPIPMISSDGQLRRNYRRLHIHTVRTVL